ncbi:MAG: hypothetical protein KDE00_05590 [Rhodobacteraceae bacterium]|nr:hypothetical protein [Paracoccaceae bacterium]
MRLIGFLAVLALVLAGAAYATRPGLADFDAMLKSQIEAKLASTDVGASDDALGTVALIGCKLRPTDCIALIRESLDVTEEQHLLFTRFDIAAAKRKVTCTGAFTKIWCKRPLLQD